MVQILLEEGWRYAGKREEGQRRRQRRDGDGKFEKWKSGKGRVMRRVVGFGGGQSDRKHDEERVTEETARRSEVENEEGVVDRRVDLV